jgi:hypothetical protein
MRVPEGLCSKEGPASRNLALKKREQLIFVVCRGKRKK